MFVSGVLLAPLVVSLSGCGTDEAPCFEGPAVTYTMRFSDWYSPGLYLAGVEGCLITEGRACGCQESHADGFMDLPLPANQEVIMRTVADGYVTLYSFFDTLAMGDFLAYYPLPSAAVVRAMYDLLGVVWDPSLGSVVAAAVPAPGLTMEGTTFELLDGSGLQALEVDGPFYVAARDAPDPEASSSVGTDAWGVFGNVPPGPSLVGGHSVSGEPVFEQCAVPYNGWERRVDGRLALEVEVFPGAISVAARLQCTP
jgi:hypothetical protein